ALVLTVASADSGELLADQRAITVNITIDDLGLLGADKRVPIGIGARHGSAFVITDASGAASVSLEVGDEDRVLIMEVSRATRFDVDESVKQLAFDRYGALFGQFHFDGVHTELGTATDYSVTIPIRDAAIGFGAVVDSTGQSGGCAIAARRTSWRSFSASGELEVRGLPKGIAGEIWVAIAGNPVVRTFGYSASETSQPIDFGTCIVPSDQAVSPSELICSTDPDLIWSNDLRVSKSLMLLSVDGMTRWTYKIGPDNHLQDQFDPSQEAQLPAGEYWVFPGSFDSEQFAMFVIEGIRSGRAPSYYGLQSLDVVAGEPVQGTVNLVQLVANVEAAWACRHDIDGDGSVDESDVASVLTAWGPCPAPPAGCISDLNLDGFVNATDLTEVLTAWGPCPPPALAMRGADVPWIITEFGAGSIENYVSWVESLSDTARSAHAQAILLVVKKDTDLE
ncbi:MAG: dockerin type I domain-containing protein, partial [Candidatus Latescibacterota bacterium]|nr:dockerin type I domain-containing protein [Candidatus Latescibacterota bacterium]